FRTECASPHDAKGGNGDHPASPSATLPQPRERVAFQPRPRSGRSSRGTRKTVVVPAREPDLVAWSRAVCRLSERRACRELEVACLHRPPAAPDGLTPTHDRRSAAALRISAQGPPLIPASLLFMCDNEIMNHDLAICRRQITFGCIGLRVGASLEIISHASTRITHLQQAIIPDLDHAICCLDLKVEGDTHHIVVIQRPEIPAGTRFASLHEQIVFPWHLIILTVSYLYHIIT